MQLRLLVQVTTRLGNEQGYTVRSISSPFSTTSALLGADDDFAADIL